MACRSVIQTHVFDHWSWTNHEQCQLTVVSALRSLAHSERCGAVKRAAEPAYSATGAMRTASSDMASSLFTNRFVGTATASWQPSVHRTVTMASVSVDSAYLPDHAPHGSHRTRLGRYCSRKQGSLGQLPVKKEVTLEELAQDLRNSGIDRKVHDQWVIQEPKVACCTIM